MKFQGKVRGDSNWSNIETTDPQNDLSATVQRLKDHGFKAHKKDGVWRIVNPITKQIECEYRLW